jgi:hypothetical protein
MIGPLIDGAIKRRKVVLGVTLIASIFGFFAYCVLDKALSSISPDFPNPTTRALVDWFLDGEDHLRDATQMVAADHVADAGNMIPADHSADAGNMVEEVEA